jgi:hypothetical protein
VVVLEPLVGGGLPDDSAVHAHADAAELVPAGNAIGGFLDPQVLDVASCEAGARGCVDRQGIRVVVPPLEVVEQQLVELEALAVVDPQVDVVVGTGVERATRLEPHHDFAHGLVEGRGLGDGFDERERVVRVGEAEAVVRLQDRTDELLAGDVCAGIVVGVIPCGIGEVAALVVEQLVANEARGSLD